MNSPASVCARAVVAAVLQRWCANPRMPLHPPANLQIPGGRWVHPVVTLQLEGAGGPRCSPAFRLTAAHPTVFNPVHDWVLILYKYFETYLKKKQTKKICLLQTFYDREIYNYYGCLTDCIVFFIFVKYVEKH